MPIGNGDIGLNVWVESSGDVLSFIGKTDAWDENMRLLKLNEVRVRFNPPLNVTNGFRQELNLRDGAIEIQDQRLKARIWVDANFPVVQVEAHSRTRQPFSAKVSLEPWRNANRVLGGGPRDGAGATSYADTILPQTTRRIGWYHRNPTSIWLPNLKVQGIEGVAKFGQDPLLNRTMGGIVCGDGFVSVSNFQMAMKKPSRDMSFQIHVLTKITDTPEAWLAGLEKQAVKVEGISARKRWKQHCQWWEDFWSRSWVFLGEATAPAPSAGDRSKGRQSLSPAETVSRAYVLQRWIDACGGRGGSPIKFNGSIFVVDNHSDADYRQWGGGYWFQNTRLAYWPMLMAGDFDLMKPLFEMYLKALPARTFATKTYYGHDGASYPETLTFWGSYLDCDYGTNRTGLPLGLTDNEYIRRYWSGGIELLAMMLDYHDYTGAPEFCKTTLIPFATQIIAFFDQHWKRDPNGKILFHPAQSLETWWNCTNPTPEIAGLHDVIPRLLAVTQDATLKAAWQKTLDDLPPVPLSHDLPRRILPAEKFADQRNLENPELYAVFPYRLNTLCAGGEALEIGRNTFAARQHRENGGWQQNSIQAALLGFSDEARRCVVDSASRHAEGFRFPAMWGPNYDWIPDQDHGGVLMAALQRMLLQSEGRKMMLLPAWPRDWNANFKLRAPYDTTVEGTVINGKLTRLKVTPVSRKKDLTVLQPQ